MIKPRDSGVKGSVSEPADCYTSNCGRYKHQGVRKLPVNYLLVPSGVRVQVVGNSQTWHNTDSCANGESFRVHKRIVYNNES